MADTKWQNVSAGPKQVKDLNKALSNLQMEGRTRDELYGVVGGVEHRSAVMSLMGPVRAEVVALDEEIRARYAGKVTRDNVRDIIADYAEALPIARTSRPVDDQRRSADEDAGLQAKIAAREAEMKARQDAQNAVLTQVMAKAPASAKALICAEYCVDASDPYTDYSASHTRRTVAIGWRFSTREDFRALRAAAGQFAETAHMASEEALAEWGGRELEHRENYSMGMGNYLSDHGWGQSGTGWIIRSASLPCKYVGLTEDAIPVSPAERAARVQDLGRRIDVHLDKLNAIVRPSSTGREGVVEIVFADKPSVEVRDELKAHGFRWARSNGCWYGRDTDYAESLAASA